MRYVTHQNRAIVNIATVSNITSKPQEDKICCSDFISEIGHIHLVKFTAWNVFCPISFLLCLTRRSRKLNWSHLNVLDRAHPITFCLFVNATPFLQTLFPQGDEMMLQVPVPNRRDDILHRKRSGAAVLLTLPQHRDTLPLSGPVTMWQQLLLHLSGACSGQVFKADCPFKVPADVKVPSPSCRRGTSCSSRSQIQNLTFNASWHRRLCIQIGDSKSSVI